MRLLDCFIPSFPPCRGSKVYVSAPQSRPTFSHLYTRFPVKAKDRPRRVLTIAFGFLLSGCSSCFSEAPPVWSERRVIQGTSLLRGEARMCVGNRGWKGGRWLPRWSRPPQEHSVPCSFLSSSEHALPSPISAFTHAKTRGWNFEVRIGHWLDMKAQNILFLPPPKIKNPLFSISHHSCCHL